MLERAAGALAQELLLFDAELPAVGDSAHRAAPGRRRLRRGT